VGRGEMPTEPGDSWFSPKCIEVQPQVFVNGGRALDGLGGEYLTNSNQTTNSINLEPGSETMGDKLRSRKGNSPDHQLRSPRAG
jgi:hypothetical protein